ncbi:DUF7210 family protein [Stutzerimonas nitrititolerans]|uniref:DUF7210 family protein n=1 Tax=Stutzerimonas nitrititolerans TaxID=2482751 RepID=UPI0028B19B11|nr:hypothetical protein [Stutzerimonas nitrititolerans]
MTHNATAAKAGDSAAPKKAAELVEVKLEQAHTHKRKAFQKGDKIKVTPAQRETLITRGIVAGPKEV